MQIEPFEWRWHDELLVNKFAGSFFTWFGTHALWERQPAWQAWVVRDEDGDVVVWGHLEPFSGPHKLHVARVGIAVAESAKGKGMGTAMVAHLCEQAVALDYRKLWATYHEPNVAAARLFAKLGFEQEGRFVAEELWDGEYVDIISVAKFVRKLD